MRIYTSYFGNLNKLPPSITPIAIVRFMPRWTKLPQIPNYDHLAPKSMWMNLPEEEFKTAFRSYLNELKVNVVIYQLELLSRGNDVALICYEKPGEFCHRRIVAEWLKEIAGITVEEYEPTQDKKTFNQLSLF